MKHVKLTANITGDYYEHNRIEIRAEGLKTVVTKPYRPLVNYKQMAYVNGAICISTNQTVVTDMSSFDEINTAIKIAVNILNAENDGLVITPLIDNGDPNLDPGVWVNNIPEDIKRKLDVLDGKTKEKVKGISYNNISHLNIYGDEKGRQYIYLGKCLIFEYDYNQSENKYIRQSCVNPINGGGPRPSDYVTHCYLDVQALAEDKAFNKHVTATGTEITVSNILGLSHVLVIRASKVRLIKDFGRFLDKPIERIYGYSQIRGVSTAYLVRQVSNNVDAFSARYYGLAPAFIK